ncbi:MAG: DUF5615 family PIN-like protein [Isosphaerales bacterium]
MPIAFVLDENLRGKPLWHAIRHHNLRGGIQIDAIRVGDPADLPLGSPDSDILAWAERADRIIITEDAATFPAELAAHLRSGRTSPGVFVIRPGATVASILSWLELVVADDQPDQWFDWVTYIL